MTKKPHVASSYALDALDYGAPPPANELSSPSPTGTLTPDSQQSELFTMATAFEALTQGCLRQITEDSLVEENPVVQCVQIKPMASQNGTERYRVVMSDSINFMQGMLGQRKYLHPSH